MSESNLFTGSLSQGTGFENPNIEFEQSAYCVMKDNVNVLSDNLSISVGDINKVTTPDSKLGSRESAIVKATSVLDNVCQEMSQKLDIVESVTKPLLDSKKHFSRCKTFTAGSTESQNSFARETSTYTRSISLPSASTLVSAMKGGRALRSTMVKSDMHVKWAPDVYEPPTTSMSHTVNGYNQRVKSKKKDKRKNKGKPSRRNGMEQKHGSRKSLSKTSPEPLNARLQGNCNKLIIDNFGKSKSVDMCEFGIDNSQEVKCGSSFLMESLPRMHLSIGEAA